MPAPEEPPLAGRKISLPQDDPDPGARRKDIEEGRADYEWDHDRHPPLPFVADLPRAENPSIPFLTKVIRQQAIIKRNSAKVKKGESGLGPPGIFPPDEPFDDPEAALKRVGELGSEIAAGRRGYQGRYSAIDEVDELYRIVARPAIAARWSQDATFAELRLAGPNPAHFARVTELPEPFPVEERHFERAGLEGDDSLEAALAEGRAYLQDYDLLGDGEMGRFPDTVKFISAPYVLFVRPRGDGARPFVPVAIQCGRVPGPNNAIFTPADGGAWLRSKVAVMTADSTQHEMVAHFGLTHMVMESFAAALPRNLARNHPLTVLLRPHVTGTLYINDSASNDLINEHGPIDQALSMTIEAGKEVTAAALGRYDMNRMFLPRDLENRDVEDAGLVYPYRDDARALWVAVHEWVGNYIGLYYTSDEAVAKDTELAAWGADAVSSEGGRIKGFGERKGDGRCYTRKYLTDALTHLVFTASAQHAAVNFQQASVMAYPALYPGAACRPAPLNAKDASRFRLVDMLPPRQTALLQWQMLYALGSVYHTQLGRYGRKYFEEPVRDAAKHFEARLDRIEDDIKAANATRPVKYTELLPSLVPQAVNI